MKRQSMQIRNQRGQAMAEFVATMLVFVAMLLGTSYLAKLSDISQNMQEAARHTAFERTVWLEATAISDYGAVVQADPMIEQSVQHHFFTGTVTRCEFCETPVVNSNYWVDQAGNPLISSINNVTVATTDGSTNANGQARVIAALDTATNAIYSLLGSGTSDSDGASGYGLGAPGVVFALDQNGTYASTVKAQVNLPAPFNNLFSTLNFSSGTTLLADEWYAGGSGRAGKKIQGLVPMALLETQKMREFQADIKEINQWMQVFTGSTGLNGSGLIFGNVSDWGVPNDRQELMANATNFTTEPSSGVPSCIWNADVCATSYGKQYTPGTATNLQQAGIFPTINGTNKVLRMYEYVPSVAAMSEFPITGGWIDTGQVTFQTLP